MLNSIFSRHIGSILLSRAALASVPFALLFSSSGCSIQLFRKIAASVPASQNQSPSTLSANFYKVVSGSCTTGTPVSVTYSANSYGPSSVNCSGGTFTVGVNFYGPSGTRSLAFTQAGIALPSQTYSYAPSGFNGNGMGFDGWVWAIAYDSIRSQIYVGGDFTSYNSVPVNKLVRLNSDGTLDPSFIPVGSGFNGGINALVWDSTNQQLYVGGAFTSYMRNGTSTTQTFLARLKVDGSLDTGFVPAGGGFDSVVKTMIWDSSAQKLYVGGSFSNFTNGSTTAQMYLTRLTSAGTVDTTFVPAGAGFNSTVNALAWDSVGQKLYAGGYFTSFTNGSATAQNYVARLNSNGSVDTTFIPAAGGFNSTVNALAWDSASQKLYAGGYFTSFTNGSATGQSYVSRLNSNGTVDTTFIGAGNGLTGGVLTLFWDSINSKLYAGGSFYTFSNPGAISQTLMTRLNPNGTVDTSFVSNGGGTNSGSGYVNAFAVDTANQQVYVGGRFIQYTISGVTTPQKFFMRLSMGGAVDTSFMPASAPNGFNASPYSLAWDSLNQKLYVAGSFTSYLSGSSSTYQGYLSRLNPDGTLDTGFIAAGGGTDGQVVPLALDQANQNIYVGGSFATFPNGVTIQNRMIRLSFNGGSDTTYLPAGAGFNNSVSAFALDSVTGKLYVGGTFTSYTNGSTTTQNNLTRLNPNGTVDTTFVPSGGGFNGEVKALAWDSANQKLYVAGWFTSYTNGSATTQNYLTRLNSNGTVDTSFVPAGGGLSYAAYSLLWEPSSQKLYVGGDFNSYTNGSSTSQSKLTRLNSNGTVDTSFIPAGGGFNNSVYTLAWDSVGQKLYVGGAFATYTNGAATTQNNIARLSSTGALDTSFNPSGGGFNGVVRSLAWDAAHQRLYCAGDFGSYNGAIAAGIVRLISDGSLDL